MRLALTVALLLLSACTGTTDGGLDAGTGTTDGSVDAGGVFDAGVVFDAGIADAGMNCPLPPATNGNGWAPEFSPDGCSLASGLGAVWVNGVLVAQPGWQPVWVSNSRIVFNGIRADGSEGLRFSDAPFTSASDVTTPPEFAAFGGANDLDGIAGVFAAYHAAGDFAVLTSAGHRFPQRMLPALSGSDGALAMISRDDKTIYLAIGAQETPVATESVGATDVDVQGDWVVWSQFVTGGRKTRAHRRSTASTIDVTASNRANEFFSVLVPTGSEMWLINFDGGGTLPDRLYLRPIGSTDVQLLHSGEVRIPTGRFHAPSGMIRVAWSDGDGVSRVVEVDPAATRGALPL